MPALAEPMITALEKRFPTVATFVELDTFATSHWYLESARCVKSSVLFIKPVLFRVAVAARDVTLLYLELDCCPV